MVEFCTSCGTSLPKGDLTIKGGELFTSHDYVCPQCGKIANPCKVHPPKAEPEPGAETDLVIQGGQVEQASE